MNCMSITQAGYTPIISAALYGHCDTVRDLLSLGAHVDAQDDVSDDVIPTTPWTQWML